MKRRCSLSIEPGLYEAALKRMKEQHFSEFTGYIENLIRRDAVRAAAESARITEEMSKPKSGCAACSEDAGT